MKYKNKNGYMLYEVLISFTLASIIIINMIYIILSLNNKLSEIYFHNQIYNLKSIIYSKITPDFYNKEIVSIDKVSTKNLKITYKQYNKEEIKELIISDDEKYISYDGEKTLFDDIVTISDFKIKKYDQFLKLTIPLECNSVKYDIELYFVNNVEEII